MPRYHVIMADPNTCEIAGVIVQAANASDAILLHPWICEVYKDTFILNNFHNYDEEICAANIKASTDWITLCVNLDEEIMKDLNGGDSSVSSSHQDSPA